jgi:hypothetical protein
VLKSLSRILSGQPEPHPFMTAGAASFYGSRSRILLWQPEPHPLTAAGSEKKYSSGARPDVQNRTIKKTSVAEPHKKSG